MSESQALELRARSEPGVIFLQPQEGGWRAVWGVMQSSMILVNIMECLTHVADFSAAVTWIQSPELGTISAAPIYAYKRAK